MTELADILDTPARELNEVHPLQACDSAEEVRLVRCGGAMCDGMTARIPHAGWKFKTGCSDCERFER